MKKLLLCSMLVALLLVSCDVLPGVPDDQVVQTPIELPQSPTVELTDPITPTPTAEGSSTKVSLSIAEAQTILSEEFGALLDFKYKEELNKYEDDLLCYGFQFDYAVLFEKHPPSQTQAYIWINSVNEHISFQEAGYTYTSEPTLYTNIPDSMFPLPMFDGTLIQYKWFSPPMHEWEIITYYAYDANIMKSYQSQLLDEGFVDHASVQSVESLWTYSRETDGATLVVEMNSNGDTCVISMYVNYL